MPLKEVKLRDVVKVIGKAGRVRQKIDHAIGVGISERLEQNRIHDREDGGVGSDAERQRGNGSDGEAGVLPEHLQRVLDVVEQVAHCATPLRCFSRLDSNYGYCQLTTSTANGAS